jgi:hypothetical protein
MPSMLTLRSKIDLVTNMIIFIFGITNSKGTVKNQQSTSFALHWYEVVAQLPVLGN